ncbi:MAG TPA: hypothetical protein VJJ72_02075 [Candidatus Paceibacterota bacterium]
MDLIPLAIDTLSVLLGFFLSFWWVWLPIILFLGAKNVYLEYIKAQYLAEMKWVLLEIRVPRDVHKSPKAMEQVFAALHSIPFKLKWKDKWIQGKTPDWLSFEILSRSGEIRFYIHTTEGNRNLVEAQIYGHFPEAEIVQVPDYFSELPGAVPNDEYDLAGGELVLTKEDAYPLKTYFDFEEQGGGKEDVKRIDPLASLAEALSALGPGEYLAFHTIFRPTGDDWIKKGQAVIDKLMGKPEKPKPQGLAVKVLAFIFKGIESGLKSLATGEEKKEDKKDEKRFSELNPGAQEAIKFIERSFVKLAFETSIRFIYVAPKDRFNKGRTAAVTAAYRQFSTQTLNGFKIEGGPGGKGLFKKKKELKSKLEFYSKARSRGFFDKPYVLTTEELATVYHFPDIGVKTPSLPRVEAKKGEPPAGLPVV